MKTKIIFAISLCLIHFIAFGQRQSGVDEPTFKKLLQSNGYDNIEGIYEETETMTKYGIIWDIPTERYRAIFLSSASTNIRSYWQVGTIKGYLYKTATEGLLKAEWYIFSSDLDQQDFYMEYTGWGLKELKTWEDAENQTYVKHYPTASDVPTNKNVTASGTGFAISSNGLIVTNNHVVDGAESIKIRGVNGNFNKAYNGKVLVSDKANDLAILQIDDISFKSLGTIPFTLKTTTSGVGESIYVLGYPLRATMGDEIKLTNGIISSKTGYQGSVNSYQISAPVQPGNSGGPLFDKNGNLIGIVTAKHMGTENVSYAIKSSYLTNLIELLPKVPKLQTINSLTGKAFTAQVEMANDFIYIIEIQ